LSLARLIERGNVEATLKERIDRILELERKTLRQQGYAGPSRLAVVAKLLELGVQAWEQMWKVLDDAKATQK